MIYLDDRTGSVELKYYFLPQEVTVARLQYGDAYFLGNGPDGLLSIGVERKTVGDLLGSIRSGRFQGHQLPGMSSNFDVMYVVIEGIYRAHPGSKTIEQLRHGKWQPLHGRGIKMSSMTKLINTMSIICGVQVRFTIDESATADLIKDLYAWWQTPFDHHKSHVGFQLPPATQAALVEPPSLFRCIVKELPGIGWEKSLAVESHFLTLDRVLESSMSDWCQIPGIGSATAEKIMKAIGELL